MESSWWEMEWCWGLALSLIITLVFAMCPDMVLSPLHKFLFHPHKIPTPDLSPHFSR